MERLIEEDIDKSKHLEEEKPLMKKIVSREGKFFVFSEDGTKKLGGPYDTKDAAVTRLRQIEGHKTSKALVETPTNSFGLGFKGTLEFVQAKGKVSAEDANLRQELEYSYDLCGGCIFFVGDPGDETPGSCRVVEGEIMWSQTCSYYIGKEQETYSAVRQKRQENVSTEYGITKSEDRTTSILKVDEEHKLVYGIVLEPGTIDAQNDVIDSDQIEKAAHEFLIRSRIVGKQHTKVAKAGVVESYIATKDDKKLGVKKGTWIMVVKVNDEELWTAVKNGEFTGFSIGGKGVRTPIAVEEEFVEEDSAK